MDNPVVDEPRDEVPEEFRSNTDHVAMAGKISERQREFLKALLNERDLTGVDEGKLDLVWKCLRISEDPEEFGMGKDKASELITWLLNRPKKPVDQIPPGDKDAERLAIGVPPGRYAVDADSGELRFYKVWQSRDQKRMRVYVCHGPDESELKYHNTQIGVLKKIKADGIREAAIRFGMEIGECSNCGRRLTNRISRELGIGPICGGRMFGDDDWKDEVKAKRSEIKARGEDPDEELGDA